MKKIFLYGLMLCSTVFAFTSCNDDEDQLTDTRVTHYATIELLGDEFIKMNLGDPWVEPGYTATEGSEDITSKVKVTGTVDTSTPGYYELNYSAMNKDNFSTSVSRTVMVINPNGLASAYFGESQYGSRHYYDSPITIYDNGNGTYTIDDLAGGFYCYGRYPGYEPTYDFHLEAVIKLNADNTIELVSCNGGDWYWGDPISITSGTYDPATGKVTLVEEFSGTPMYVTLTK
jgi:hypothetical protein